MRPHVPLSLVLSAALLASCSGEPPVINRVSAQLLYVEDLEAGTVAEELSVHVVPEDEDGLDDLEYLHVISDGAELYWTLDSSTWTRTRSQNDEWLGTARLAMPAGAGFPRGEYRVLLYDLSGDSDEDRFRLDAPVLDPATISFPHASVASGRITLAGPFPWYTLLVYTTAGTYVRSWSSQAEGMAVQTIRASDSLLRSGFTVWVYAWWQARGVGLVSGPYAVE